MRRTHTYNRYMNEAVWPSFFCSSSICSSRENSSEVARILLSFLLLRSLNGIALMQLLLLLVYIKANSCLYILAIYFLPRLLLFLLISFFYIIILFFLIDLNSELKLPRYISLFKYMVFFLTNGRRINQNLLWMGWWGG